LERFTAKIFWNGGSQAVRLPKQFRVQSSEVEIWRDGDELHLRPIMDDISQTWNRFFADIDRIGWDVTIEDREQTASVI
jgi:antitoxin VapB